MTTTMIPAGWSYDKGDPSAGIFGDQWVHEDCTALAGPGHGELEGCSEIDQRIGDPDEHGLVLISTTVNCHDCGAGIWFEHKELG